jgi:hypothetical protein
MMVIRGQREIMTIKRLDCSVGYIELHSFTEPSRKIKTKLHPALMLSNARNAKKDKPHELPHPSVS